MNYFQLTISIPNAPQRELLIAALSEAGIEGFEEDDNQIKAFVSETDYQEDEIAIILQNFGLTSTKETIAPTNWNAQWEADFDPVVVDNFCSVRAHFHPASVGTTHEVIITPKMSFGTGHHATTHLMIQQMAAIDFNQKSVFDFGTGTGVLAILAEKLGAKNIVAIDNDEWSFENTKENIELNNCHQISVSMDDIENIHQHFDIILANINRHILLQYMPIMFKMSNSRGILLMSGLLTDDEQMVCRAATEAGFMVNKIFNRNNWIAIQCHKN